MFSQTIHICSEFHKEFDLIKSLLLFSFEHRYKRKIHWSIGLLLENTGDSKCTSKSTA